MQKSEVTIMIDNNKRDNVTTSLVNETLETTPERYPTSESKQFWSILKRIQNDWILLCSRLFAHIFVGLLVGALYYDIGDDGSKVLSNIGFLFFNVLFLMYISMTINILSFPLEIPFLFKKSLNKWYSLNSYYLAMTVFDITFQAIFSVIYVAIVYFLTSQPYEAFRFCMFLGTCLLTSLVAQSLGLVIGTAVNVRNGIFLSSAMSVPLLLFSGFFISFDAMPEYLKWISYISYIRYGFEGIVLATYSFGREKLKCFTTYCHFKKPNDILVELDMKDAHFTLDVLALFFIFLVLRIAAYLFLHWKLKLSRKSLS